MLIRCARHSDLDALLELSAMLPPGMTSMPADRDAWRSKLQQVAESLAEPPPKEREAMYLLVLESDSGGSGDDGDSTRADKKIVGCAGIVAGVGLSRPFYSYKRSIDMKASEELGIRRISSLLNLVNDFTGDTELISLYLLPDHRRGRAGQFLSRCRFLFMSDFPQRFGDTVFAEIRGWLDADGNSPFWRHLGEKFFQLPFAEADFISAVRGSHFITELMPQFPVYLELLPEEAKAAMGRPHDDAVAAMKLLQKEGFRYEDTIDIFDGGPVMECRREGIASISGCRAGTVESLQDTIAGDGAELCMLSNRRLQDYRLVLGPVQRTAAGSLALQRGDAESLGVREGDSVNTLAMR